MGRLGELEPVPRRSTVEIISDELRSAIMYGSLEPGSQLGEVDLATPSGHLITSTCQRAQAEAV